MKHPHLNIDLVIDDYSVEFETQISMREEINSVSSFTIGFGDPFNLRQSRVRTGSVVKIYLSWGNITPQLYMTGIVTRLPKNISKGNVGVTATGSDYAIRADDKQAWDSTYEYLEYTNRKASDIISNLMGFVPTISTSIKPYSSEPKMSWECSSNSSIIDNVKSVCEYAEYEWQTQPNGSVRIRRTLEEVAANTRYMLLLGNIEDFSSSLPDLGYSYIQNISIGKDESKIRNFYKVEGKNGIYGTGFNQFSINSVGRQVEGYHKDERLTSVQACQVAARTMAKINGSASRPIEIKATGVSEIRPGDVVYIASVQNRSDALPGYYRLLRKNSNIGAVGWRTQYTFGRLKQSFSDVVRAITFK